MSIMCHTFGQSPRFHCIGTLIRHSNIKTVGVFSEEKRREKEILESVTENLKFFISNLNSLNFSKVSYPIKDLKISSKNWVKEGHKSKEEKNRPVRTESPKRSDSVKAKDVSFRKKKGEEEVREEEGEGKEKIRVFTEEEEREEKGEEEYPKVDLCPLKIGDKKRKKRKEEKEGKKKPLSCN